MNLNYKGLINILGLQKWIDRLTTLETTVENLPTPTAGGNGIYGGSGEVTPGTLASIPDGNGSIPEFAFGNYPNWPNIQNDGTEKGFYYSPIYNDSLGMVYNQNRLDVSGTNIVLQSTDLTGYGSFADFGQESTELLTAGASSSFSFKVNNNALMFNNGPTLRTGTGSPEGVVTASIGSIYLNTAGGGSTTLYIKTSGAGNTGWTAK